MKTATKTPCAECPFKKTSMRGYLGPWASPEELIFAAHSDLGDGFACHMTVKQDDSWEGAQVCAGSLICANKSFKTYRDDELRKLQQEVEDNDDVMNSWEFIEYHGGRSGTGTDQD